MLKVTQEQIEKAIQVLKDGGVIVYPTETSYGLGCDASNEKAVARIFVMKGRAAEKGLPVIIDSKQSVQNYVEFSILARQLSERFWPGALNIIAPVVPNSIIADSCSMNGTQSVRLSHHPFASILAKRLGKPIVATSANVSGKDAIYSVKDVQKVFADQPDKPDLVIDGGVLPDLPASTSVKVIGSKLEILRQGRIDVSDFI